MDETGPPEFTGTSRFTVERRLGAGGMGVVYQAHDTERGTRVALKVLPRLDPLALSRFKREFRSLAEIVHPNLIELYELVGDGEQWFFTMRVAEGTDFLSWVGTGREDGHARLRDAMRQLTLGVQAVHAAGRLHRDLKPSNVMVEPDGRLVILDFGLVSQLGAAPDGSELAGTAAYMAPEQWAGTPLTEAADWYAVGVMLFQALTGSHPFTGAPAEVLAAKLRDDGPAPSLLAAGIPESLDRLCADLLRRDPAARPAAPEILSRLDPTEPAGESLGGMSRSEGPVELVGREEELRRLEGAFVAMREGSTVTVHVQGASGTGKTSLVDRALADLSVREGTLVLRGRCYEQESVPYKALDSLVDALADHLHAVDPAEIQQLIPVQAAVLARVFPVLLRVPAVAGAPAGSVRGSDPRELRRVAVAALRELLVRLGQRCDLVLAIDDLQWGDLDGATVLDELLAPPDPPRLMLVLSYRSEYIDRSPCLAELHRRQAAASAWHRRIDVALTPLSQSESEALAHRLMAPTTPAEYANVARVARESGGNPYFIYELSRHVDTSGLVSGDRDDPLRLDAVLWSRVERLSVAARDLLAIVAVAGQPIAMRHLLAVAADRTEVMRGLALLKSEHLVRGAGAQLDDLVEAYHDRVRESVASRLAPEAARRYHVALARTFEAAGTIDPETIAMHFAHGGEPEPAGVYYAKAAAAAAEALAFDRAATLYRRALDVAPRSPEDRAGLQRELGHALANAGRGYQAAQAYEAAVQDSRPEARFELERLAASQYCFSGHIREGRAIFRRLLRQSGMDLPTNPVRIIASLLWGRLRLRLRGVRFVERQAGDVPPESIRRIDLLWSIVAGLSVPDALGVAALQSRGLRLALEAGEPYRVARALAFEAFMTSLSGSRSRARAAALMGQAESLARRLDHPHAIGVVQLMQQMTALNQSRFVEAVALGEAAEATLRDRCSGVWWELAMARTEILWALWHQGDCQALRRRTPVILADALDRGDLFLVTNLRSVVTPFLHLLDDEPDAAINEVGEALAPWPREGFNLQHANEMFSEANALIYRGRGVEALESVDRRWPALRRSLQLQTQLVRLNMTDLRARALLAAAEREGEARERLLARAERDRRSLARERAALGEVFEPCLRAGIASLRGDRTAAVEALREAIFAADREGDGLRGLFARHRLAALVQGDERTGLEAAVRAGVDAQGVRNPARLAALYLPGFPAR